MKTLSHFINGKIVTPQGTQSTPVFNPSTGEHIKNQAIATDNEVNFAIENSLVAFESWKNSTPLKRARIFFKYKELIEKNFDKIAKIISEEHGKVFNDAQGELTRGLEVVEFVTGIPHLLKGDFSMNVGTGVDSYTLMQPHGVCVGITPFNFPAMVPMWMFPVAIACGNTFILKPSEKNPSTSLFLAELLTEAGLPDGVFNVINGQKPIVDALLTDNRIQTISFVGSTPIAHYINQIGSNHHKKVQALGGAKNHMLIMPDANIQKACEAVMGAAYGSAGERCMAISILVVVGDETAKKVTNTLKPMVENLKIGNGNDNSNYDLGPVISKEHRQKIIDYINDGKKSGAKIVCDGRNFVEPNYPNGYYLGGTLFDNVTCDMKIYKEEIFGPVLSIVKVNTEEEAIELINNHEFANGTSIFTKNGQSAKNFEEKIQVGMVGINVPIPVPMAYHSFGGWKNSNYANLNMHGPDGIRFFTKMKTITRRWLDSEDNQFIMPTSK